MLCRVCIETKKVSPKNNNNSKPWHTKKNIYIYWVSLVLYNFPNLLYVLKVELFSYIYTLTFKKSFNWLYFVYFWFPFFFLLILIFLFLTNLTSALHQPLFFISFKSFMMHVSSCIKSFLLKCNFRLICFQVSAQYAISNRKPGYQILKNVIKI